VPYLLRKLLKRLPNSLYIVWLDNLFSSTKLFNYLRDLGFEATGTVQVNSGICVDFVAKKKVNAKTNTIP
jgi:hypothetical protein